MEPYKSFKLRFPQAGFSGSGIFLERYAFVMPSEIKNNSFDSVNFFGFSFYCNYE